MSESIRPRAPEPAEISPDEPVLQRVRDARSGLTSLLREAEEARRRRAEVSAGASTAICAWNHFENIPTFYNWNNRPR
jgi:hypothetical protein